jgi:hypothetical protein
MLMQHLPGCSSTVCQQLRQLQGQQQQQRLLLWLRPAA